MFAKTHAWYNCSIPDNQEKRRHYEGYRRGKTIYGTGSYPPLQKGLHRATLITVSTSPFIIPCFFNASIAYTEHVGLNLQEGGKYGDMAILYSLRIPINTRVSTPLMVIVLAHPPF